MCLCVWQLIFMYLVCGQGPGEVTVLELDFQVPVNHLL